MTCPRCISRPITGRVREPGFSKERRLDPQITIGLLTDRAGFPLMVEAFEGNKAETRTMLPVIIAFMAAHQLPDVTVVADAGMISEANQQAIKDAELSFILGTRIPDEPYAIAQWRREHPGQDLPDGQVFIQPWPATGAQKAAGRRDKIIYYQYKHDTSAPVLEATISGNQAGKVARAWRREPVAMLLSGASMLMLPLTAHGTMLGFFACTRQERLRRFDTYDVEVGMDFAFPGRRFHIDSRWSKRARQSATNAWPH